MSITKPFDATKHPMFDVRLFRAEDVAVVAVIIRRCLLETNSRDYPEAEIQKLAKAHSPAALLQIATTAHFYTACQDGEIVGCGAITPPAGVPAACTLRTVFVSPDWHRCGIGHLIVAALERDPYAQTSARITLRASITACRFYENLGYRHQGDEKQLDVDGLYPMEKDK